MKQTAWHGNAGPAHAAARWGVAVLLALALPTAGFAGAPTAPVAAGGSGDALDAEVALAVSRAALENIPGDYLLLDRNDRETRLSTFRGKPLLVNFIYTGCYQVCPNSTRALLASVRAMRSRFGDDQFNVVSIGFDQPTDSPAAMRNFAARQHIDFANWHFLSPRKQDVEAIARDFGFSYVATPMGYEHTLQVSIVDALGRIRRQVIGETYSADSLGEPLKSLITGSPIGKASLWSDLLGRVRILCSIYDPVTGEYRTDYSLYLEIAGGLTFILAMLWFVISEWKTARAARRLQQQ